MEPATDAKAETARILRHLRQVVEDSSLAAGRIEAESGLAEGGLAKILSGETALEFRHLIAVLEAVGLSRAEFFAELYPG